MKPPEPNSNRDPLSGYLVGNANAVRAVRPPEPTDAEWAAVSARIQERLRVPVTPISSRRWNAFTRVAAAIAVVAVAGVLAWLTLVSNSLDVAQLQPPESPTETIPDPLAEFAVLPMANSDDVDLQRVPGSGWLPTANDPFSNGIALATTEELELEETNPAWQQVTLAPGDAPMIFATKPR